MCVAMEMTAVRKLRLPPAQDCIYTPCYCEENVWKLCEYISVNQDDILTYCYVIFISNRTQAVPLWQQSSGNGEGNLAVWDYHVILVHCPPDGGPAKVFDLDTILPFPSNFEDYCQLTLRCEDFLKPEYHRWFRVVPAADFLKTFASDRSRMIKSDGTWLKPPPSYPCIQTAACVNNLEQFVNMDPEIGIGEVLTLKKFLEKFHPS